MNFAAAARDAKYSGEQRYDSPSFKLAQLPKTDIFDNVGASNFVYSKGVNFDMKSLKNYPRKITDMMPRTAMYHVGSPICRGINKPYEIRGDDVAIVEAEMSQLTDIGYVCCATILQEINSALMYAIHADTKSKQRKCQFVTATNADAYASSYSKHALFQKSAIVATQRRKTFGQFLEDGLKHHGLADRLWERNGQVAHGTMDAYFVTDSTNGKCPFDPAQLVTNHNQPKLPTSWIAEAFYILPNGSICIDQNSFPEWQENGRIARAVGDASQMIKGCVNFLSSAVLAESVLCFFAPAGQQLTVDNAILVRMVNSKYARIIAANGNCPDLSTRVRRLIQYCFATEEQIKRGQRFGDNIRDHVSFCYNFVLFLFCFIFILFYFYFVFILIFIFRK